MSDDAVWDVAVVGAGPAGTTAALAALRARPDASVLLLDRAEFPRDKVCGDGVAPHVLDLLATVGVTDLVHDLVPVRRLRLERGGATASREMPRPAWVVPRMIFDARLARAACDAGAVLRHHRVRHLEVGPDLVTIDGSIRARTVIGADGAHSRVRKLLGLAGGSTALALRGYAPTPARRRGEQVIAFGTTRQPSYAWSFDRGDGLANVGYGEVLHPGTPPPSRRLLLDRLEELLPAATVGGSAWRAHHLPLSGRRWCHPDGRVLLVGDAARLVNPLTGEGIYYAAATGLLAGRRAVLGGAVLGGAGLGGVGLGAAGDGSAPGAGYRRDVRRLLGRHLQHTAFAAALAARGPVLAMGTVAAAQDQRVFDDLVELGLGRGRITPAVVRGLARAAMGRVHNQGRGKP